MSQVTLNIGGRNYTVSCGDGEEAHVRDLGRLIDDKVTAVTGGRPTPEAQSLLFAALMLADQVHETSSPENDSEEMADALERVANSLERCAQGLESGRPAS